MQVEDSGARIRKKNTSTILRYKLLAVAVFNFNVHILVIIHHTVYIYTIIELSPYRPTAILAYIC